MGGMDASRMDPSSSEPLRHVTTRRARPFCVPEVLRHTMAYYARRVLRLRSLDPQASEPGGAVARRATSGGGAAAASGDDDDAGGAESGGRGGGTSGGGGARGAANGEAKQQGGGGEWGEAQELREAAHPTPQKNGEVAPLSETASGNGGARAQY